jgi:hypothetical protein
MNYLKKIEKTVSSFQLSRRNYGAPLQTPHKPGVNSAKNGVLFSLFSRFREAPKNGASRKQKRRERRGKYAILRSWAGRLGVGLSTGLVCPIDHLRLP